MQRQRLGPNESIDVLCVCKKRVRMERLWVSTHRQGDPRMPFMSRFADACFLLISSMHLCHKPPTFVRYTFIVHYIYMLDKLASSHSSAHPFHVEFGLKYQAYFSELQNLVFRTHAENASKLNPSNNLM